MGIAIIEDREGYVLLGRDDDRYAVIERRAGRFYSLHSGDRQGVPCEVDAVPLITEERDWVEEERARKMLWFAVRRRTDLAERIW